MQSRPSAACGWAGVKNGELLRRMRGHFDVLVTTDRGIASQQRLPELPFGVVVVRAPSNRMEHLRPLVTAILSAIGTVQPGRIETVRA